VSGDHLTAKYGNANLGSANSVGEHRGRAMNETRKLQSIEERLKKIEERLANAEEYLARDIGVEGKAFLHFDDWRGRSGHPLWVKNFLIPTTMRARARKERALRTIEVKTKDRRLSRRRREATGPTPGRPILIT